MKKTYLVVAMICMAFISCSEDETAVEKKQAGSEKREILNFVSYEKMDEKIGEISLLKREMETNTASKYTSVGYSNKIDKSGGSILINLKKYHTDRINDIYSLRKKLNFVSIQSIADEINSLKLINPLKSNELFTAHKEFLTRDKFEVTTIFKNETSNVINENGKILINGQIVDLKKSENGSQTGRYLNDELVKEGQAALSPDWRFQVVYVAGRQKHKDTFGRTFFRYFTEFKAYYMDPLQGHVATPTTYTVTENSIAGFSQSGDNPLADFAFILQYPSGTGSTLRNVDGQKWTAYQTEGGYIKGTFSGAGYVLNCDLNYTR
ncbi:hypothetical protein [Flavobacterium poyangense]|uniref:hypothetical protein n=1 Tax=Flavobacterium poyangense TaxID=2204302 RepID=UPI00142287CF|nr:hypothetical protein [Flavobacterium sp. JXAS1]